MSCHICNKEHGADNQCCPKCKHYNAILGDTCRDCGYKPKNICPHCSECDTLVHDDGQVVCTWCGCICEQEDFPQ